MASCYKFELKKVTNLHYFFLMLFRLYSLSEPLAQKQLPEEFERYRVIGLAKGFLEVVSGPMVRSSYRAERALEKNNAGLSTASI